MDGTLKSTTVDLAYRSRIPHLLYDLNKVVTLPTSSRFSIGTNIFSEEWDLCIVLDACRVDALQAVAPEYPFLGEVNSIISVGSATPEWVGNTFTESFLSEIQQTAYVASHGGCQWIFEREEVSIFDTASSKVLPVGFIKHLTEWSVVRDNEFKIFDRLWKTNRDNEYAGTTKPETVTDRAITIGREEEFERMVIHYKQPHAPYVANAIQKGRDLKEHERAPWEYLRNGGSRERVWEAYLDELRWGLDSVSLLLDNFDAERVVITADHGDAFGEWGIYSHPLGIYHPHTRRVPWVETSAADNNSYEPEDTEQENVDQSLQNQLEHLGYR